MFPALQLEKGKGEVGLGTAAGYMALLVGVSMVFVERSELVMNTLGGNYVSFCPAPVLLGCFPKPHELGRL